MDDVKFRKLEILKRLIDHPLFNEAIGDVKQQIFNELLATLPAEDEKRTKLYYEKMGFDRFVGRLNAMAGEVVFINDAMEKKRG
jgi:hypothetical protein